MPLVASVNYTTRRIYLSSETVNISLDTMDIYKEIRALRVTTESHRSFKPMIIAGGNILKAAGNYTQPYVQLLYGCRIVPYDANQVLTVIRDTFTDDGQSGAGCFDRSTIISNVDIDMAVSPVEVREVIVGGGIAPTAEQNAAAVWSHPFVKKLLTVAKYLGLK